MGRSRASIMIAAVQLVVADSAIAQTPIRPGLWDETTKVERATGPGAPPAIVAMVGKATRATRCITPEAAQRGPTDLLSRLGPSCTFQNYDMHGGRLDARMVCERPGGTTTSTLKGLWTGDRYDGRIEAVTSGKGAMTLVSTYSGTRTGNCP